jgi:hypothetical protein
MASLEIVVEQLKSNGQKNTAQLTSLNSSVLNMNNMLGDLTDALMMQRLDMLEMMREKKDTAPPAPAPAPAGDTKAGTGNLGLLLAGLAAFAGGFIGGILDSIKKIANLLKFDALFDLIKGAVGRLITNVTNIIKRVIDPIIDVFRLLRSKTAAAIEDSIKIIDDMIQPIKNLFQAGPESRIGKLFSTIMKPFMFPFEGVIDDIVKPFKGIFQATEGPSVVSRIIGAITKPFTAVMELAGKAGDMIKTAFSIFDEGSGFMKVLGGIGKVIGKLFFPLTIIMTAFDTVKGAIAGFEKEGIIGGIKGAVEGFLNSLIGAPLDLLKDAAAWVMKKLGFDDSAEALQSFSFGDIIKNIVFSPLEILKRAVNSLIEGIAKFLDDSIIPGTGKLAAGLRSFKFEEGQLQTEADANKEAETRIAAKRTKAEGGATKEAETAKMTKSGESANRAAIIEEDTAAISQSKSAPSVIVSAPSSVSTSSSNTQPILSATPAALDYSDPMLAGA